MPWQAGSRRRMSKGSQTDVGSAKEGIGSLQSLLILTNLSHIKTFDKLMESEMLTNVYCCAQIKIITE